jgi:serine/threonine protein kinase
MRDRFRREAEILGSLKHPHILPVYPSQEVNGLPCIVMKFVPGGDLRQMLRRTLDAATVLTLFRHACGGVNAAHEKGIFHRDLKPANLLVEIREGGPHLYVADFGIAIGRNHSTRYTAHGKLVGSDGYIPPEFFLGEPPSRQADVFSLGCCLQDLIGIHDLDPAIHAVIAKATDRSPMKRHRDAIALYEDAVEAFGAPGGRTFPPRPSSHDPDETRIDSVLPGGDFPVITPHADGAADRALAQAGLAESVSKAFLVRARSRPKDLTAILGCSDPNRIEASDRSRLARALADQFDLQSVEVIVLPDGDDLVGIARAYLEANFAAQALERDFDAVDASWQADVLELELAPRIDRLCDNHLIAPLAVFLGAQKVRLKPGFDRRRPQIEQL